MLLRRKHSSSREMLPTASRFSPVEDFLRCSLHIRDFICLSNNMDLEHYVKRRSSTMSSRLVQLFRCQEGRLSCKHLQTEPTPHSRYPNIHKSYMSVRLHSCSLFILEDRFIVSGALGPSIQSCMANHSLQPASAACISFSDASRSGRRNGTVSSGDMSYDCLTFIQLVLFAAKRKLRLSISCNSPTPPIQSSPKNPCSTAGVSCPVATSRRMYGMRDTACACAALWPWEKTFGWRR